MKKEDLSALGITDEALLDKIVEISTAEISAATQKIEAERDGLQGQLNTVNDALKKFDGVDVAALQGEISTLKTTLGDQKTQYEQKLADMEFSGLLDNAVSSAKGRNAKAISALLDMDALKASKNQAEDIKAALNALKEENEYLFESDEVPPPFAAGTGSGQIKKRYTPDQIGKMSMEEYKAYREQESGFPKN